MDTVHPTTDNFLIRHATAVAIATVNLLMLLAAFVFWRQGETSQIAKGWVAHTYEVRAQKSLASVPIIALTARAMPEEQEKCMAAGANDYLSKPVDTERLLTLLRVWLFRQEMAA